MDKYEETKKNYNRGIDWHIQKSSSYNWKNQIERFVKGLKGKRVLDAGCGGGRDIAEFIKRGIEVDGIDYSRETIKKCKEQFPKATFYEGDMRKIDLPDNTYDGIWACASLLNLKKKDILLVLFKFKRILKSNGKLFISVKEGEGERMIKDRAGQRFFSFYSLRELKRLVEKAGFKVNYTEIVPDAELTGKISKPVKPALICLYAVNP